MKQFLLFFAIFTIVSQVAGSTLKQIFEDKFHSAPDICSFKQNWALIAHPHDCRKFYVCANYLPEEMTCPQNYYFDKYRNRCVFGSCNSSDICEKSFVRRVPDNCHSFEICRTGNYVRVNCQEGSYFDEQIRICRPIEDTPQHKCSCILPPNSIIKNFEDCSSYYICINGQAILKRCRQGYYFNSYLNSCIVDLQSVCLTAPKQSLKETAMVEACERVEFDNGFGYIFQPDSEDCRKFSMCINGYLIEKYCPDGFYYNRELHFCEEDGSGNVCAAIREQARKIQKEKEKEAQEHEIDIEINHYDHQEVGKKDLHALNTKPPAKLTLSSTHMKLDVENNTEKVQHTEDTSPHQAITPVQTDQLKNPVIPDRAPIKEYGKYVDGKEMTNNSAEGEQLDIIEMKLPLSELKLPIKSQYSKLASKFILF